MCGIVGFTDPGPDAERTLRAMMAPIRYRGPDDEQIFVDEGLAVGHLRLTVVDPVGGRQPRVDRETGDVLVYNGEIYDYRAHADRLRSRGIVLRDESDTEVLFQTIRLHGVAEALDRLDGMFAFAYRDGATRTVTLARDRFGEKPLFYSVRAGRLVFASELKGLLCHPASASPALDLEAIDQYLTFDYVPAPRTGLEGVAKLRPGHLLVFDGATAVETRYWRPMLPSADGSVAAAHGAGAAAEDRAVDRLERLLDESIRARLIADVPVGLFLSGGIDSALIAALASRHAPGVTAFTIKFSGDGYDETPYAAMVAREFGLKHVVQEVSDTEIGAALDVIEARIDEPFADPSVLPSYLLSKVARQSVTVALGGDGGDELFAGYINFQANRGARLMAAVPRPLADAARRVLGAMPVSDRYMGMGFKLAQLSHGLGCPETRQPFLWMAPFDERSRRRVQAEGFPDGDVFDPIDAWLDGRAPTDPVERLQYLFTVLYLPDDILTKVDRASMYNSLEVRSPFLARTVAEFALSLPPSWKIRGLRTKYLLRRLAARMLPRAIVERPKHGFAPPVAALLRGRLRERVHDTLLDTGNPLAGWFRRPEIERMLGEHMARRRDHRKRLWSLYCLFRFAATVRG